MQLNDDFFLCHDRIENTVRKEKTLFTNLLSFPPPPPPPPPPPKLFPRVDGSTNPFPNKPWFTYLQFRALENTVGKGEIARNEQFLLFPQCFQPVWRTLSFSWKNLELSSANSFNFGIVVWERVKCAKKD